jgi:hypothetical protein
VALFDLGGMRRDAGRRDAGRPDAGLASDTAEPVDPRLGATLYRLLMRWFPQPLSRDISLVHRALVAGGRAEWLEDVGPVVGSPGVPVAACSADLDRALARVRGLVAEA